MPNYYCRLKEKKVPNDLLAHYLIDSAFDSDHLRSQLKTKDIDESQIQKRHLNEVLKRDLSLYDDFIVEVAFGLGDFLIHSAKSQPNTLFLGIDYALPVVQRAILKMRDEKLENIVFFYGRAEDFFRQFHRLEIVDLLMVNYPDPWPKDKHIKRRIINEINVGYALPFIKSKTGRLMGATDIESLHHYHMEELLKLRGLKNIHPNALEKPHSFYDYSSMFERRARTEGRKISYYFMFQKD